MLTPSSTRSNLLSPERVVTLVFAKLHVLIDLPGDLRTIAIFWTHTIHCQFKVLLWVDGSRSCDSVTSRTDVGQWPPHEKAYLQHDHDGPGD